jgi:hypothetical protein
MPARTSGRRIRRFSQANLEVAKANRLKLNLIVL